MRLIFYDTESDGLVKEATKLHCLSYKEMDGDVQTVVDNFSDLFQDGDTWIAHNQFSHDLPLIVNLGIIKDFMPTAITLMDGTVKEVQLIDSLALSREYWPDNPIGHGLEAWAKKLGTFKPHIDDWEGLPIEDYIERCEEDVITTEKLFIYLADKLEIEIC